MLLLCQKYPRRTDKFGVVNSFSYFIYCILCRFFLTESELKVMFLGLFFYCLCNYFFKEFALTFIRHMGRYDLGSAQSFFSPFSKITSLAFFHGSGKMPWFSSDIPETAVQDSVHKLLFMFYNSSFILLGPRALPFIFLLLFRLLITDSVIPFSNFSSFS